MRYFGFLILSSITFLSCRSNNSEGIKWVGCEMWIDSVYIKEDATRGAFSINDTLGMHVGFESLNYCFYDSIKLVANSIPIFDKKDGHWCTVGDVKAPFWIYKNPSSDTLYLVQNGRTFLFQIPEQFCGDPSTYWKGQFWD
jgi:hypothetical protein